MKHKSEKCLKGANAKKHACYVLITCAEPSSDGKMEVEMTYEGDATLAAYLLQGAQVFMDEQGHHESLPAACSGSKVHPI